MSPGVLWALIHLCPEPPSNASGWGPASNLGFAVQKRQVVWGPARGSVPSAKEGRARLFPGRGEGQHLRRSHTLARSAPRLVGPPPQPLPSAALGGRCGRGPMPTTQRRMRFPPGHASWPFSCSVDVRQTSVPPSRVHQGFEGKEGPLLSPGRSGAPRTAGGSQGAGLRVCWLRGAGPPCVTQLSGLQSVYERQGIAVMTPTVPGSPKGPFLGLPRGTMRRQKSIGKQNIHAHRGGLGPAHWRAPWGAPGPLKLPCPLESKSMVTYDLTSQVSVMIPTWGWSTVQGGWWWAGKVQGSPHPHPAW